MTKPTQTEKARLDNLFELFVMESEGLYTSVSDDNIGDQIGHGCHNFAVMKNGEIVRYSAKDAPKYFGKAKSQEISESDARALIPMTRLFKLDMCRKAFPNFDNLDYQYQVALELLAYKSTDQRIINYLGDVKDALKRGDFEAAEAEIRNNYPKKSVYSQAWGQNQDIIADIFAGKVDDALAKCEKYYADDKPAFIAAAQEISPTYKNSNLYIAQVLADPAKMAELEKAVLEGGKGFSQQVWHFQTVMGIKADGHSGEVTQYAFNHFKEDKKITPELRQQALAFQDAKPSERALMAALPLPTGLKGVADIAASESEKAPATPPKQPLTAEQIAKLKELPNVDKLKAQLAEVFEPKNLRKQVPFELGQGSQRDNLMQMLAVGAPKAKPTEQAPTTETVKSALEPKPEEIAIAGMFERLNPTKGEPIIIKQTSDELSPIAHAAVVAVQKSLKALGCAKDIPENHLGHVAGGRTANAIKKLQEDAKLNPNGVTDKKTYDALQAKIQEKIAVDPEAAKTVVAIAQEFEAEYAKHLQDLYTKSKELPSTVPNPPKLAALNAPADRGVAPL